MKNSPYFAIKQNSGNIVDVIVINSETKEEKEKYQLKNNGTIVASKKALKQKKYIGLKLVGPFEIKESGIDNKIIFDNISSEATTYDKMLELATQLKACMMRNNLQKQRIMTIPEDILQKYELNPIIKGIPNDSSCLDSYKNIRVLESFEFSPIQQKTKSSELLLISDKEEPLRKTKKENFKDSNLSIDLEKETKIKENQQNIQKKEMENNMRLDIKISLALEKAIKKLNSYGDLPFSIEEISTNQSILMMLNTIALEAQHLLKENN